MMQYMVADNLSKFYGDTLVFEGASFSLHSNQKIALIGPNGSGKSTLLKIIAGVDLPDTGNINLTKGTSIGYASQHVHFPSSQSILSVMLEAVADKLTILDEVRAVELQFAEVEYGSPAFEKVSNRYEKLQQEIALAGTHQLETKIQMLLTRFGFSKNEFEKDVLELSGGQQIRLHLAKLLLAEPDVLLLDEPTNHLDIETIIWLENYLQGYKKAIIFISHDEQLLQGLSTNVWQVISGELITFNGSYDKYQVHINEYIASLEKQQEAISKEKAKLADFVDRNLTRASTTGRAQSARKRLNKMEDVKQLKIAETLKPFTLHTNRQSGKFIYKLHELTVGYDQPLFDPITFDIDRFDRVALVGKNGIGKSTLLNTLFGTQQPLSGSVEIGHHVDSAYFLQQQVFVKKHLSVYDTFSEVYPDSNRAVIYPVLARFGFSQDDVHLSNTVLSGGEKQRLLLALLYFKKANTLLLDEPTNHLDIPSKDALTESLKSFDGTIIFASHDRSFIRNLATKIIFIHDEKIHFFDSYDDFNEYSQQSLLNDAVSNKSATSKRDVQSERIEKKQHEAAVRRLKREISAIESSIEQDESAIQEITVQLGLEAVFSDIQKATKLAQEQEAIESKLNASMQEWELKQGELEILEMK